jgi:hypothetical protein
MTLKLRFQRREETLRAPERNWTYGKAFRVFIIYDVAGQKVDDVGACGSSAFDGPPNRPICDCLV